MAKPYGQNINKNAGRAGSQYGPGGAVHDRGLKGAVEELNSQHPYNTHVEGLQHKKGNVNKPARSKAVI